MLGRIRIGVWLVACLLITTLVYRAGLDGGFMFDDYPNIVTNPAIQIQTLHGPLLAEVVTSGGTGVLGRPLSMLSFAVNHATTGLDPFPFKATNLFIHLLNGLLVFWFARALALTASPDAGVFLPLWVAAAWLLHPVNLPPVLHVVQRMTELSALFTLAGLLLYLHLRVSPPERRLLKWAGWFGVPLLWLLGFLSKETAVLAPLFAMLIEISILNNASIQSGKFRCHRCLFVWAVVFALSAAAVIIYLGVGAFSNEAFHYRDFNMFERAMTELRVLWFYVQLILLPQPSDFGLFHDDIAISRGWLMPWTTLTSAFGWLLVLVMLVKYGRRIPLVAFGVAWFLVGHLLESTILALELVHEHRNYLPAFGLLLAASEAGRQVAGRTKLREVPLLALTLALVPIAVVGFNTMLRAYAYGNPVRLVQIEATNHPDSARSQYEVGRTLMANNAGLLVLSPEARKQVQDYFQRAAVLDPNWKQPLVTAISFACIYRDPLDPVWANELARRWRDAMFGIADRTTVADITQQAIDGRLCLDDTKVFGLYEALLANPRLTSYDQAMVLTRLGAVVQAKGWGAEVAREHFRRALSINPSPGVHLLYADLLEDQGDLAAARTELEMALRGQFNEDWQQGLARELATRLRKAEQIPSSAAE